MDYKQEEALLRKKVRDRQCASLERCLAVDLPRQGQSVHGAYARHSFLSPVFAGSGCLVLLIISLAFISRGFDRLAQGSLQIRV